MGLRAIWTIIKKEVLDNQRDRRAVTNALFTVLFNPLLYIFLFGFLNRSFSQQAEQALQLPVLGAELAPNLVAFLDQRNVDILPPPADIEAALRAGDVDLVLVIPDDFGELLRQGQPAPVELWTDESNQGASVPSNRAAALLRQYSAQIGSLRLLARGVSPLVVNAMPVEHINISPEADDGIGIVLNLLPVIMLTAAFFGGFYLAVDITAGERERDSLEPLLMNPIARWQILGGKYFTVLAFAILATALATALFLVLLGIPLIQDFTSIRVALRPDSIGLSVLLMVPVVFMAVAIEMFVASYARSVKEAQTYTQFVALAGFLPSLFLSILPIKQQAWMSFIPTVAQLFLVNKVSRGEPLPPAEVIIASTVTLAVAAVAFAAALRLYNTERIVLGR